MIRTVLDRLYLWSGYVAAFFLAAIAVAVIMQIVGRFFGWVIESTEVAGFCMAASTFFALAHSFRRGSHIRINLLVSRLRGRARRAAEVACCVLGALIVAYVAVYVVQLAWQSFDFGDTSPGLLAMPFWIPQTGMALGLILLAVALMDEAISVFYGQDPCYEAGVETALDRTR